MRRNLIAASLIVCFSLTQLTPAFALRPTGLESSDEGRAELTSALTTAASGLEQRTNSPDGKYVAIWIQGRNVVSIHKFDNHRLLPMGEIHADAGIRDVAFDQSGEAKLGVDLGHALIVWDVEGMRQMDRIETNWLDPSIRGVYDRYFTTERPWSVRPTGASREGLPPGPLSDETGREAWEEHLSDFSKVLFAIYVRSKPQEDGQSVNSAIQSSSQLFGSSGIQAAEFSRWIYSKTPEKLKMPQDVEIFIRTQLWLLYTLSYVVQWVGAARKPLTRDAVWEEYDQQFFEAGAVPNWIQSFLREHRLPMGDETLLDYLIESFQIPLTPAGDAAQVESGLEAVEEGVKWFQHLLIVTDDEQVRATWKKAIEASWSYLRVTFAKNMEETAAEVKSRRSSSSPVDAVVINLKEGDHLSLQQVARLVEKEINPDSRNLREIVPVIVGGEGQLLEDGEQPGRPRVVDLYSAWYPNYLEIGLAFKPWSLAHLDQRAVQGIVNELGKAYRGDFHPVPLAARRRRWLEENRVRSTPSLRPAVFLKIPDLLDYIPAVFRREATEKAPEAIYLLTRNGVLEFNRQNPPPGPSELRSLIFSASTDAEHTGIFRFGGDLFIGDYLPLQTVDQVVSEIVAFLQERGSGPNDRDARVDFIVGEKQSESWSQGEGASLSPEEAESTVRAVMEKVVGSTGGKVPFIQVPGRWIVGTPAGLEAEPLLAQDVRIAIVEGNAEYAAPLVIFVRRAISSSGHPSARDIHFDNQVRWFGEGKAAVEWIQTEKPQLLIISDQSSDDYGVVRIVRAAQVANPAVAVVWEASVPPSKYGLAVANDIGRPWKPQDIQNVVQGHILDRLSAGLETTATSEATTLVARRTMAADIPVELDKILAIIRGGRRPASILPGGLSTGWPARRLPQLAADVRADQEAAIKAVVLLLFPQDGEEWSRDEIDRAILAAQLLAHLEAEESVPALFEFIPRSAGIIQSDDRKRDAAGDLQAAALWGLARLVAAHPASITPEIQALFLNAAQGENVSEGVRKSGAACLEAIRALGEAGDDSVVEPMLAMIAPALDQAKGSTDHTVAVSRAVLVQLGRLAARSSDPELQRRIREEYLQPLLSEDRPLWIISAARGLVLLGDPAALPVMKSQLALIVRPNARTVKSLRMAPSIGESIQDLELAIVQLRLLDQPEIGGVLVNPNASNDGRHWVIRADRNGRWVEMEKETDPKKRKRRDPVRISVDELKPGVVYVPRAESGFPQVLSKVSAADLILAHIRAGLITRVVSGGKDFPVGPQNDEMFEITALFTGEDGMVAFRMEGTTLHINPPVAAAPTAGLEGVSQKAQVQIFRAAGQIVEALWSTGPVNSLAQLFPALIEEAATENIPEQVPQALLAAFGSLEADSEKRHLTGSLGQAMMTGLHEFSEDFEPDPYPRTLPGHKTIWTVTTSPTIDIDAKRKLANWSDRKGVLVDPGGGGINVAIALARRGVLARPVFFYVGETGKLLIKLIENRGVFVHEGDAIELKGNEQTRVTIIISLDKAESLVPKGTPVDDAARRQMVDRLLDPQDGVKSGDIVAISGSLAPGLPEDFYAGLGRQLVARGAIVVVDTKGAPARAVLFSKPAAATIYSQNNLEFGELVGVDPRNRNALIAKASEIIESQPPEGGIREIVITRGASGAVSVTREKVLEIPAPEVEAVSELGAGDTSLAKRVFRAWQGKGHDAGFVYGVAAGTASVLHPGTGGGLQAEVDHFAENLGLIEETKVEPSPPTAGLEEKIYSPDGKYTATWLKDAHGLFVQQVEGSHLFPLALSDSASGVQNVAFNRTGKELGVDLGRVLLVWDVEDHRQVNRVRLDGSDSAARIYASFFGADGSSIPSSAGLEAALERAVDFWSQGPFSTPPEAELSARTVFVLKGANSVIPVLAEHFQVVALARSGLEDELLRGLVTPWGIGRRVQIRPEEDLPQVLAELKGDRIILVDSAQPNWRDQLMSILKDMGVLPLGSWDAGLEAVDAYMKHQV